MKRLYGHVFNFQYRKNVLCPQFPSLKAKRDVCLAKVLIVYGSQD